MYQGAVSNEQPAAGPDLYWKSVLGHAGVFKDRGHCEQPDFVLAYGRDTAFLRLYIKDYSGLTALTAKCF